VRELVIKRLHGREDGATLIIVVLCLIALIGMVVLVVDVGGLLLNRREMVNASDAAALSAAKSCVLPASVDPRSAEQAADELATSNSARSQTGLVNILQVSGCDSAASGYVTVQYGANQQLFFAGIFGAGQGHITTQATAIWGPPGAANPMPIVVYEHSFNNCKLNQTIDPNATCYVWEDNNNTNGSQNAFGFLDLRTDNPSRYGWNSVAGATCPSAGASSLTGWINGYPDSSVGDLSLNYPNPTYVCMVSGNKNAAWAALANLVDDDDSVDHNDDEDILLFPINRCDDVLPGGLGGQLNTGTEVPCDSTIDQYDIIGFVAMKLKAIYTPNQVSGSQGNCAANRVMPGVSPAFSLDTFGIFNGCFSTPPDVVSNIQIRRGPGTPNPQPVQCATVALPSCDWTYDQATRTVTWNSAGPARDNATFRVSFDWQVGGACGVPPAGNNSGHCLILQPVEVRIGGSQPGTGSPNSNVRAYKLCEPSIPGSCNPIAVPIP
jgi:Flp pilus assembly protein TadG